MNVNLAELDFALAEIDAEPRRWNQTTWIDPPDGEADLSQPGQPPCGTVMCLAGFIAWRNDWRPASGLEIDNEWWRNLQDGRTQFVRDVAADVLNLWPDEAGALFHWSNTRERLQELRDDLAAGRPISEPEPVESESDYF